MDLKVPSIHVCVAISCCAVALIFQFVAVAGTGWIVGGGIKFGLFRYCVFYLCGDIYELSDWLRVTQAFSILGLLTIAGSLVLGILHAVLEDTHMLSLSAIATSAASVILLIVELAVYGANTSGYLKEFPVLSYGYGFILSAVACVLSGVAAALFAVEFRK